MQPLITPNWHIALVHFPIALIVIGTLVELFSFLGWRGSAFRRAGRWMLLLGAIWAVPTTFSGLYAWHYVLPKGGFAELQQAKPELAKAMTWHIWTQAGATLGSMAVVVLWLSLTASWRDRLNILFKLLLIGISGLILFGAHLGGESVYNHGLGVDTSRSPTTLPNGDQAKQLRTWEDLFPPEQTHVTLAGLAAALACVTLGLAIHTASNDDDLLPANHAERIAAAFAPQHPEDPTLPPAVPVVSRNATPPFPVARFWLLSALLLIVTALVGDWIIAQDVGWKIQDIWDAIRLPVEDNGPAITRRLAHLIAGGVIIVDTLILALLARFAPRQSLLLLAFALPLVLALVAQVWLGVLLLFDGPAGLVTRFNG
jgi:uncharacterized membrane protein